MQTAFLIIYTIFYFIALLALLPHEYFKRPKAIRNRWIREKFGFFKKSFPNFILSNKRKRVWIHAISVGEVIGVTTLVKKLSEKYDVILSTITDTGQSVAMQRFRELPVNIIYLPFDTPCAVLRTIKFFKPSALILVETEIWANLISLSARKFPVIIVNGRLSKKSFKGYKKIKFFIKPLLNKISMLCVQDETYKNHFLALGAEEKKIHVTGNLKFDIELKVIPFEWEKFIPKPVIIAGSTHETEEELILKTFLEINTAGTLIIAPRHPERFDEVEKLIGSTIINTSQNITFKRLRDIERDLESSPSKIPDLKEGSKFILLIDKIGILGSLYRIADIAIVGGSFIPHGGQNPLEPAYWKKAIVCGPSMHNFPFIEEFIREKACLSTDRENLKITLQNLIENREFRNSFGEKAYDIFLKKSGGTTRTLKLLESILP